MYALQMLPNASFVLTTLANLQQMYFHISSHRDLYPFEISGEGSSLQVPSHRSQQWIINFISPPPPTRLFCWSIERQEHRWAQGLPP